jgi:hypothetical protein
MPNRHSGDIKSYRDDIGLRNDIVMILIRYCFNINAIYRNDIVKKFV